MATTHRIGWLLLGAILGVATTLLAVGGGDVPERDRPNPAPSDALPGAGGTAPALPVAPLERRLGDVESRLAELTDALAGLVGRIDDVTTRRPIEIPRESLDPEVLARAMEQAEALREREAFDSMSDAQLLAEARRRHRNDSDPAGAERALESLLARALSPQQRAEAGTELGILRRESGDLDASREALRGVVDAQGVDTAAGAWAAYQLAWTLRRQADRPSALALAETIALSPGANPSLRIHGRWLAASLAHELGDLPRARAACEALLRDCGDEEGYRNIVADVERRLREM